MAEHQLDAQWSAVLAAWDDPESHRRFLALAEFLDCLGEAGRRYREIRDADPARAALAQARIDEIVGRAMARLRPTSPDEYTSGRKRVAWAVSFASLLVLVWVLFRIAALLGEMPLRD